MQLPALNDDAAQTALEPDTGRSDGASEGGTAQIALQAADAIARLRQVPVFERLLNMQIRQVLSHHTTTNC